MEHQSICFKGRFWLAEILTWPLARPIWFWINFHHQVDLVQFHGRCSSHIVCPWFWRNILSENTERLYFLESLPNKISFQFYRICVIANVISSTLLRIQLRVSIFGTLLLHSFILWILRLIFIVSFYTFEYTVFMLHEHSMWFWITCRKGPAIGMHF